MKASLTNTNWINWVVSLPHLIFIFWKDVWIHYQIKDLFLNKFLTVCGIENKSSPTHHFFSLKNCKIWSVNTELTLIKRIVQNKFVQQPPPLKKNQSSPPSKKLSKNSNIYDRPPPNQKFLKSSFKVEQISLNSDYFFFLMDQFRPCILDIWLTLDP